jgi:hypothetical protein
MQRNTRAHPTRRKLQALRRAKQAQAHLNTNLNAPLPPLQISSSNRTRSK